MQSLSQRLVHKQGLKSLDLPYYLSTAHIPLRLSPAERNGGTRAPKEVEPLTLNIQQHTKKNLNGLYWGFTNLEVLWPHPNFVLVDSDANVGAVSQLEP